MSRKHRTTTALVTVTHVANATGYRVFWGVAPRTYDFSQDIQNAASFRVPALVRSRTYYFTARAYLKTATNINTSTYGNEVKYIAV